MKGTRKAVGMSEGVVEVTQIVYIGWGRGASWGRGEGRVVSGEKHGDGKNGAMVGSG